MEEHNLYNNGREGIKILISILQKEGKIMIDNWFKNMIDTIYEILSHYPKKDINIRNLKIPLHIYQWLAFRKILDVKKYLPSDLIILFNREYVYKMHSDSLGIGFNDIMLRIKNEADVEAYLSSLLAKSLYPRRRIPFTKIKYYISQSIMCLQITSQKLIADIYSDSQTSKKLSKDFKKYFVDIEKELCKNI